MSQNETERVLHADLRHVVYALSDALDLVGVDDIAHGKRVGIMAAECARTMGLGESETTFLFDLGLLHDIGVSSTNTHQHLVGEFDWAGSQDHAIVGQRLLAGFKPLATMAEPIRYHHTRWDKLVAAGVDARVIRQAMVLVGGILVILGFSLAITNWLVDAEVPEKLFGLLNTHIPPDKPFLFLLALNLFLLVFGMLLEGFPAIILLVPLVLPVALKYGVDPVHLGIIFLANLQLGIFLPPLGINLYLASARFGRPVTVLVRAAVPFFLILLAATLIVTYWPALSLWLARPATP